MKLSETSKRDQPDALGQTQDDLLRRMRSQGDELSSSMNGITEFLLREGTGIADLGMGQVAALSYSSKATLVRYARKFGYEGWRSFREDFLRQARSEEKRSVGEANVDINYPFAGDTPTEGLLQRVVLVRGVAHHVLQDNLDSKLVDRAAGLVVGARRVVFLGNPPNRQYGELLSFNLDAIGVDCRVPHNETQEQELRHLDGRDCVIAASYSGDVGRGAGLLVSRLGDRGIPSIAVTGTDSPLAQLATVALEYPPLEHYYTKVAGFYSCECISVILDWLFCACYRRNFEENRSGRLRLGENLSRSINIADELG